jgi:hypothetical protein
MKILQKEITGTQTSFPSNIINTWSQNQMSWYENLLKRWTQIDCPRRAIKSFQFVHFASNCALSVPLCVLPPSLSLSIHPPLKNKLSVSSLQTRFSFRSRVIGRSRSSFWASCIWVAKQQTWCTQCRTLSPLQCSADGIWEACKHADEILPALMPNYFTKSVFLQGHGEPGGIRIVKMGPSMAN